MPAETSTEQREPREGTRENIRENGRTRGGRGRGRGRSRGGERGNYGDAQNIAGAEQPSVAPDAFTHPKQEQWTAKPRTAPTETPVEQPGSFAPPSPAQQSWAANSDRSAPIAPPHNITTEPVVTRVTPEGDAGEGGEGRKGWWNKLMGA